MATVERIPFRAMKTWKEATKRTKSEPCALAKGLWTLFRSGETTLKVWSADVDQGDHDYCDIQLEVPQQTGPSRQLYLATLISKTHAQDQRALFQEWDLSTDMDLGMPFEDWVDPFSMPTIQWPHKITKNQVLTMVRSWQETFWPDWPVQFEWGEIDALDHLWERTPVSELTKEAMLHVTHYDLLLSISIRFVQAVRKWSEDHHAQIRIVSDNMIAILGLHKDKLSVLEERWPDHPYVAVPSHATHYGFLPKE